jgi:uncharacterized protein YegL
LIYSRKIAKIVTRSESLENFAMVEFDAPLPENRQPRCPCVLVLDTSGSMHGAPIDGLNASVANLPSELKADPLAMKRVEVAVVTFPPVHTAQPFASAEQFAPPTLIAEGSTPLGAAVKHALSLIEERKTFYRAQHLEWFRPWIFLITDGAPDFGDDWRGAAAMAREAIAGNKVALFAVGVPGADMEVLREFSNRPPINLVGLRFGEMFQWLSRSLGAVSRSASHTGGTPDAKVSLPGVVGWGEL